LSPFAIVSREAYYTPSRYPYEIKEGKTPEDWKSKLAKNRQRARLAKPLTFFLSKPYWR
jgi:hypothetical protein